MLHHYTPTIVGCLPGMAVQDLAKSTKPVRKNIFKSPSLSLGSGPGVTRKQPGSANLEVASNWPGRQQVRMNASQNTHTKGGVGQVFRALGELVGPAQAYEAIKLRAQLHVLLTTAYAVPSDRAAELLRKVRAIDGLEQFMRNDLRGMFDILDRAVIAAARNTSKRAKTE